MSTTKHHELTLTKREAARLERAAKKNQQARKGRFSRWLQESRKNREALAARPGPRGWARPAGGAMSPSESLFEVRGTTVQVCGLYPFVAGSGLPVIGAPLGYHLRRRSLVCADPSSWFLAGIISNPSAFILGQPGLGKTSLVHRFISVSAAWGYIPMILADSRPDYVLMVEALNGQVISFSPGKGHINPMDLGPLAASLWEIEDPTHREQAIGEMIGRRRSLITGLTAMMLGRALRPHESSVIAQSLVSLDPDLRKPPLMHELITFIKTRPDDLRTVMMATDDRDYDERVRDLLDALISLGPDGVYGDMFSKPTTAHIRPGVPVVFDISGVNENDAILTAAVQSLCWNLGSATVSAEQHLAVAAGRPRRTYLLVMDELWRVLRASEEMVHFIDTITRLNRGRGIAQVMVTHTMNDLKLSSAHLTATAWGFVERSSMVFLGGLAKGEMGNLREVFSLSQEEMELLSDWTAEAPVDYRTGKAGLRPGAGNFILKTGKQAGTPFHTELTSYEFFVSDTNRDWEMIK